jgi:methylated-DNA-[protein]-cysteine S-methyltransferase
MTATPVLYRTLSTPIGPVRVACRGNRVVAVHTGRQTHAAPPQHWRETPTLDTPAVAQLIEYFAGRRRVFDVELELEGTPFQRTVWHALASIPFGETCSYAQLARRVGRPGAARAVGSANARNPVSIILPCHRVVGADGRLTGYAGGVDVKEALLGLEADVARRDRRAV